MTTNPHQPAPSTDAILAHARRLLPRILLAWAIAVVAVIALALGFMNFDDVGMIWQVPVGSVALVILCTAAMDLVYAARWRLWLRLAEPTRPFSILRLWTYVVWSRAGSQLLPIPAVSIAIRAGAVKTAGDVTGPQAVCSVAPDPVLDLYQFLLVLPVTVALLTGYLTPNQSAALVCAMLLIGAVFLMTLFPCLLQLTDALRRLIRRRGVTASQPSNQRPAFDRRVLLAGYALTVLRYLFVGMRLWCLATAVGLTQLAPAFFAATGTVTQGAHMTTITPGALGSLEGGWFAVLRSAGVPAYDATLFVTTQRILIWLAIALLTALLTAAYFAVGNRRSPGAAQPIPTGDTTTLSGVAPS